MKKLFSTIMGGVILLTLPMCLTSCEDILGHWERPVPATPGTPSTPTVSNIYLEWDGSALAEKTIPEDAKPLTASETSWSGTYIVKEDVTFNEDVTIAGDVDLIIMDGKTLTINGKHLQEAGSFSFKLSIYAQSEGDEKGKLVVNTTADGDDPIVAKDIDIHGGDISVAATGNNTQGFYADNRSYIYGGKITASGTSQGILAGDLNIYGGDLIANAGATGPGAGGIAIQAQAGNLYIYGGTVTANGGNASGSDSKGGDAISATELFIYGGTVTATGGERTGTWTDGYGIHATNITIFGGTVTANGGSNYSYGINGNKTIISGGNVSATSTGLPVILGDATINGTGVKVEMTRTDAAGDANSDDAKLFIYNSPTGSIEIGGTDVFADWVTASNKISYFLSGGTQPIAGLTYDTTSKTLTYQP